MRLYTCFHWKHFGNTSSKTSVYNPTFWGNCHNSFHSPWVTLHQANVVSWDVGPLSSPCRCAETFIVDIQPFFLYLIKFRCFRILDCYFSNVTSFWVAKHIFTRCLEQFWIPEFNKVLQIHSDLCFSLEKTWRVSKLPRYSLLSRENTHQPTVTGQIFKGQILRLFQPPTSTTTGPVVWSQLVRQRVPQPQSGIRWDG